MSLQHLHVKLLPGFIVAVLSFSGSAGAHATDAAAPSISVETGMDRSNMATEWTLGPPGEPNVYRS